MVQPLEGRIAASTVVPVTSTDSMVLVGPTYLQDPHFPLDGLTPGFNNPMYAPLYALRPVPNPDVVD